MWNKYKKEYFYSLEDILLNVKKESSNSFSTAVYSVLDLEQFLDAYFVGDNLNIDNDIVNIDSEYFNKLWQLVYARYRKHYCIKTDEEIKTFTYNVIVSDFWITYLNIWIYTRDKYIKLLSIYKDQEDKLMNQISSESSFVNRFNDTPQDKGDFDSDEYTTNINHGTNTAKTDGATPIARIEEISRAYELVYLRWVNEFDKLFMEDQKYD